MKKLICLLLSVLLLVGASAAMADSVKLKIATWTSNETQLALLGSFVDEFAQKKGIDIDYTFESMDINRIEAQHELDNPASGRVMEKCGMRKEGVLRQRLYNKGKFVDVALYAILKSDPRKPVGVPSQTLQGN